MNRVGRDAEPFHQPIQPTVAAALFFAALAAWCVRHGYQGITHDAILYSFQALAHGDRAYLKDDLYLRYGSQDAFTVFSPLYRLFIDVFGFATGGAALVLVGQALWIGGALALFRALTGAQFGGIAFCLVLLAALNPEYAYKGVFRFAEGFATPRLWCEALCFWCLASVVTRRWVWAAITLIAALALHPIIALVSAGLAVIYLGLKRRIWFAAIPMGFIVIALGVIAEVGPLNMALVQFDEAWLEPVRIRSPHLFTELWTLATWLQYLADLFVIFAAVCFAPTRFRRFLIATAIVSVVGVLATVVFSDLLKNVLITQVQPWRAAMLARVLAIMALAYLILSPAATSSSSLRFITLLTILAQAFMTASPLATMATAMLSALCLAGALLARLNGQVIVIIRVVLAMIALAGFLLTGLFELAEFENLSIFLTNTRGLAIPTPFYMHFFPHVVVLMAVLLIRPLARSLRGVFIGGAAASLILAAPHWDKRAEWALHVAQAEGSLGGGEIGHDVDEVVYWQGGDGAVVSWFGLNRKSYVSLAQGAGIVFARETAVEYARRARLIAPFDSRIGTESNALNIEDETMPNVDDLLALCRSEMGPDVVVLVDPLEQVPDFEWKAPLKSPRYSVETTKTGKRLKTRFVDTYYFYKCDGIT